MIADPEARGRALAEFHARVTPALFTHLDETGLLPDAEPTRAAERGEWECFALHACVRGLVAAGGFGADTATAVNALHRAVLESWMAGGGGLDAFAARRDRMKERHEEYGAIDLEGGASGAASVTRRLGAAAARHLAGPEPPAGLAELAGTLHEVIVEGATTIVRETE